MEFLQEAKKNLSVAQTMVNNGIAKDIDEALSIIKQKQKEESRRVESEPVESVKEVGTVVDNELDKKVQKIEQVLQDFGKFFVQYKEENVKKINDLSEQIAKFRQELVEIKSKPRVEPKKEEAPKQESTSPRTGNHASNDVAIDKVFNNAHGRLVKR